MRMRTTIGIPFYNAEETLADAIRSVFAQTYEDWELLLVDDGSTDRSLEIAMSVKDSRVRVLSDGDNRRLPYRLNQITTAAKYEFIGRMDADDLMSPTRFEKQVAILEKHPEYDLVTTGVCSISDECRPIGVRSPPNIDVTIRDVLPMRGCVITHPAVLGRKAWFLRNPYDVSLQTAQDVELWVRTCAKGDLNIHLLPDPLYYYREGDNVSVRKMRQAGRVWRDLFRRYGHMRYGWAGVRVQIAKRYCKTLAGMFLVMAQQQQWLLKRRNTGVDPSMKKVFDQEIAQVRRTHVPGLE